MPPATLVAIFLRRDLIHRQNKTMFIVSAVRHWDLHPRMVLFTRTNWAPSGSRDLCKKFFFSASELLHWKLEPLAESVLHRVQRRACVTITAPTELQVRVWVWMWVEGEGCVGRAHVCYIARWQMFQLVSRNSATSSGNNLQ